MKRFFGSIMLVLGISLLSSCDQGAGEETRHPMYIKAQKLKERGGFAESAKAFEEFLRINPYSAKSHYELAVLYDESLDDPLLAIYHYRRYLEMEPDSPDKKNIETWLQSAEKNYCSQLKLKYSDDDTKKQLDILKEREKRYIMHLTQFRNENAYLKGQLGQKLNPQMAVGQPLQDIASAKPPADTASKKKDIPDFYVVKSGDTLSRISKEIYGDIKYFKLIFDANKDTLTSENLQIGQKLKIPKLPEKQQE